MILVIIIIAFISWSQEKFAEIQETGRDHQTLVRTNYNFASDDDDEDSDSDDEEEH